MKHGASGASDHTIFKCVNGKWISVLNCFKNLNVFVQTGFLNIRLFEFFILIGAKIRVQNRNPFSVSFTQKWRDRTPQEHRVKGLRGKALSLFFGGKTKMTQHDMSSWAFETITASTSLSVSEHSRSTIIKKIISMNRIIRIAGKFNQRMFRVKASTADVLKFQAKNSKCIKVLLFFQCLFFRLFWPLDFPTFRFEDWSIFSIKTDTCYIFLSRHSSILFKPVRISSIPSTA